MGAILAPELGPANPLDIWAGEKDVAGHVATCLSTVLADEGTGIGAVVTEFGVPEADTFSTRIAEGLARLAGGPKPVLAIGFFDPSLRPDRIMDLERSGVPVLDGLDTSFEALAQLRRYETSTVYTVARGFSAQERQRVEAALEHSRRTTRLPRSTSSRRPASRRSPAPWPGEPRRGARGGSGHRLSRRRQDG
ncbi:hypothetical protein [Thauera sp. SDU_THAU2]|uniref:hypothetical protein n=1 Tax=Thauera sp. SDU_THAU2 TaxID=3136633 RepID=UPI00311D8E3B